MAKKRVKNCPPGCKRTSRSKSKKRCQFGVNKITGKCLKNKRRKTR